jgi:hypothetical protein
MFCCRRAKSGLFSKAALSLQDSEELIRLEETVVSEFVKKGPYKATTDTTPMVAITRATSENQVPRPRFNSFLWYCRLARR